MLRRRGNIWVWIIGIPVILGAAAHWGFHYFVKSRVDAFILEAAPRAAIKYKTLDTSLAGKVTLGNVSILPTGFDEDISVRIVQLQGPDVFSYLLGRLPVLGEGGAPPEFLKVIMRDIVLDISGDRAASLDENLAKADAEAAQNRDVCKAGGSASFSQLQELGVEQVRGDGKMGYRHIAHTQKLYVDVEAEFKGIRKLSLSMELNNVPALDMRKAMGVALANLKLDYYVDPEFGQRVIEYCAEKRGLTPEQYSELLADEMIREMGRNGIILGYGLSWALKNYLKHWGNIMIELSPPRPVGMASLMNLSRAELSEKLGLQLAINGQLVTDLYFSIQENAPLLRKSGGEGKKKAVKPLVRYKWEWRNVSLGQLSSYLDHRVRVSTVSGVLHEGKLVGTSGKRISVQKNISGGKFIAHLVAKNIRSVQVRVKVKVEPEKSATEEAAAKQADAENAQSATEQGESAGGNQ